VNKLGGTDHQPGESEGMYPSDILPV